MKLSILKGSTSVLVRVFIQDSSSTTGAGLTGLAFNTASLVCYRARDDDGNAGGTAITLATATKGTWATGGFVEKDSTNMPGWYEFGIPNAALATGSRSVSIHFKGATNMAPLPIEIELTGWDNQSATDGGLSKLTSLTFTVAGKADANVYTWNGTAVSSPATAGIPDVNVKNMNNVSASAITTIKAVQGLTTADTIVTVSGNVNGSVASVTAAVSITSTLKKNTARAKFAWLMTDSTTHVPTSGLTVTATRQIDGAGSFTSIGTATDEGSGWYNIDLAAGDLNGNVIAFRATATGADDYNERIVTQP